MSMDFEKAVGQTLISIQIDCLLEA